MLTGVAAPTSYSRQTALVKNTAEDYTVGISILHDSKVNNVHNDQYGSKIKKDHQKKGDQHGSKVEKVKERIRRSVTNTAAK